MVGGIVELEINVEYMLMWYPWTHIIQLRILYFSGD